MRNHNLEEFNQFWTANFKNEVPPLPKKPNDLSITEQEIMRSESPKLYQNLFKTSVDSGQLPADLEMRIRNSNLWVEDADRLRKFGYEYEAQKIETAKAQFENEQLEKKIAESQARQEEQQKKMRQHFLICHLLERTGITKVRVSQWIKSYEISHEVSWKDWSMTSLSRGRPSISESELTPAIKTALAHRVKGKTWKECAKAGGNFL